MRNFAGGKLLSRCPYWNLCPFMQKTARKDIPRWAAGLILAGLTAAAWRRKKTASSERRVRSSGQPASAEKTKARNSFSTKRPTCRDWKEIAKRVFKALSDDRLLAVAAGIVFYGLLA